jgi:aldehyde dehydrogenase (NAD+)
VSFGKLRGNIDNLEEWLKAVRSRSPDTRTTRGRIVLEAARDVPHLTWAVELPLGLAFGPLAAAIGAGNCCQSSVDGFCAATGGSPR